MVVLDKLVALIVPVLRLILRHRARQIALVHPVHAVIVLRVHIVILADVGPLRWVLRALAVVRAVLVGGTCGSGHLRAVESRSVGYLVGGCPVFVRVGALTLVLQLVLWVVVGSASVLCRHSVAVASLSVVLLI